MKRDMNHVISVKFPVQPQTALVEEVIVIWINYFFSGPSWKRSSSTLREEQLS